MPVLSALPHLSRLDLYACDLRAQGCMAVARALKDRDGAVVDMRWNGVIIDSAEGIELCRMPGINVLLQLHAQHTVAALQWVYTS